MGTEAIELVQNWKPERFYWPAFFSEKLDGVPIRFVKGENSYFGVTRQNEIAIGMQHIEMYLPYLIATVGGSITGEMYIEGKPFKEISGLVRDHKPHADLVLNVFDADCLNTPSSPYGARLEVLRVALEELAGALGKAVSDLPIRLIPGVLVYSRAEAEAQFAMLMAAKPKAEGAVLHYVNKPYQPGKRLYTTQRMKPTPTIDLRIVGFEEAVAADTGQGLGMVGRVIAEFNQLKPQGLVTTRIGIGPGALKHKERIALWIQAKMGKYVPRIAEVKYMHDETYDALRQPTFVRWRDDKTKGDVLS